MEDCRILDLYFERSEEAITQTCRKYGGYCYTVADNILHSPQDAEECVNDTWLHAWNAIPPQRPVHLRLFLARITRNLSLNRCAKLTAEKRGGHETALILDELAECLESESDVEDTVLAKELEACIDRFVRSLPKRDGNLFIRRYFFAESIAEIAERFGMTQDHVSVVLCRTRKKLKSCFIKEGYLYAQK